MEKTKISETEESRLLQLEEDHFNDFKSARIQPAKLQETFVAFANADGGDLLIGIEDKKHSGERICGFKEIEEANGILSTLLEQTTPSVENLGIEFLETKNKGYILHISIPKSPKVHYTASGDCFLRINASKAKLKGERITQLSYSKGAEPYEKKTVEQVEIDDITESKHLRDYIQRIDSKQKPEVFLRKQRLLTKTGDERIPNVGCVLLFDEEPQASMNTRCAIKVYRLRTTEKEYKREQLLEMPTTINGPIEQCIRSAIEEVKKLVDGASFHDGSNLIKLNYPAEALKEILVNAVIHRDYSLNDDIHVRVYDNRVEVMSPGKLPGYMTTDNLYDERFSRNPNIVRMLHNLPNPVNHDIGEGLDTARNELKKAGLVAPEFDERENSFIVTIRHQRIASIEDVIISHLQDTPSAVITNKLIRQLSGEDDVNKVKKALQKLRSEGILKVKDETVRAFKYEYVKA
ncbi:MAG TPA: RNA-binding domain-containing protein [Pseudomonas sp.]|nr:RNA-binding domain-containing protein [Pseudomonas sp.]